MINKSPLLTGASSDGFVQYIKNEDSFVFEECSCSTCSKKFRSFMALYRHARAKRHSTDINGVHYPATPRGQQLFKEESDHQKIIAKRKRVILRKEILDKNPRYKAVEKIVEDIKRQKDIAALKASIHAELTAPEKPYFNTEAYQIAIRTMPTSAAFKLAKDEVQSKNLLRSYYNESIDALEAPVSDSKPVSAPIPTKSSPDVKVSATFTERTIKARTNQGDFSKRVSTNFGGVCAITGSGEGCQAAHINPVNSGDNSTSNGIFMLSSLHYLFDNGFMFINPETLTIHFTADCTWFAKAQFEGKALAAHSVELNKSALITRWGNSTFC